MGKKNEKDHLSATSPIRKKGGREKKYRISFIKENTVKVSKSMQLVTYKKRGGSQDILLGKCDFLQLFLKTV